MLMRGKELLASDRLDQLAGKESRTSEGERRTSEALTWLDKRLDADLKASMSGKQLPGVTDIETPVATRAETQAALRTVMPSKSKAELLREKIERRGMPEDTVSIKSEYASTGRSYLSVDARSRLNRVKEGHQVWAEEMPAENRDHNLWADQAHRQRASLVHVKPFPDLGATSKAARASAAPFISEIYDQIFVDGVDDTCGKADVEPIVDRFQDCTLVLDESWDTVEGANDSVGGDFVGRRSHYERMLTQNIAHCLKVPLHRIKVNEMRPGPSWYRVQELIIDLTLLPDAGGLPPTCKDLCDHLSSEAKSPSSPLRARMPAVRVELPQEDLPYHQSQPQNSMTFSFLRGGIVEEPHKVQKPKNQQVDNALIARDHVTTAPQHVQYMVQKVGAIFFRGILLCSVSFYTWSSPCMCWYDSFSNHTHFCSQLERETTNSHELTLCVCAGAACSSAQRGRLLAASG